MSDSDDDDGYFYCREFEPDTPRANGSKKHYLSNVGADSTSLSAKVLAQRNIYVLINQRKPGQGCYKFTSTGGCALKQCMCMSNLREAIVKDLEENDREFVKKKWTANLQPFCELILAIADDPENTNTLCRFLDFTIPFTLATKANAVIDYMVLMDGEWRHFCVAAMWEILGFQEGKWFIHNFMNMYLHTSKLQPGKSEEEDTTPKKTPKKTSKKTPKKDKNKVTRQAYFRTIALPTGPKLEHFLAFVKLCIKDGKLHNLDVGRDDHLNSTKFGQLVASVAATESRTENESQNKTNLWNWWNDTKQALAKCAQAGDLFVIAHPKLEEYAQLGDGDKLVSVFTVDGITGYISPGSPRVNTDHVGNAGSLDIGQFSEMLKIMKQGAVEKAGYNSLGSDLVDVPGSSQTLRTSPDRTPSEENNLLVLTKWMGIKDEELRVDDDVNLENFMMEVKNACVLLAPDKFKSHDFVYAASLVVSARIDYTSTTFHAAQVPHMSLKTDTARKLKDLNIVVFVATVPLSREGCFLRVHKQFDDDGSQEDKGGQLVFVPFGTVFIQPGTMVHGGGFRTGPTGNPRIQFELYLVPRDFALEKTEGFPLSRERQFVHIPDGSQAYYRLLDPQFDGKHSDFKSEVHSQLLKNVLY